MLKGGMRVRVYWNLHKKMYSVQDAKTGRVIHHTTAISLKDCKLSIRKAGQARARREGRKNVHAFVTGTYPIFSEHETACYWDGAREVTYNPYKNDTFMREGEPVSTSPLITMGSNDRPSVWAI